MSEASGSPTDPGAAVPDTAVVPVEADGVAASALSRVPRAGVPVWRVGKPDAFLAADVATALTAVRSIAAEAEIGKHLGARSEGVRCVSHLFESTKPGYRGWVWFATLARVSRGKSATVNEVGLLPSDEAVLAPAWLPWAERVRPEDAQEAEEAAIGTALPADPDEDVQDYAGNATEGPEGTDGSDDPASSQ